MNPGAIGPRAAASRTTTCCRTWRSISSSRCSASSRRRAERRRDRVSTEGAPMSEPFLGEIRIVSFNFPAKRLGLLQRPVAADQPEPGALFAAGHDVRRQRPDTLSRCPTCRAACHFMRAAGSRSVRTAARRPTRSCLAEMPAHTHAAVSSSNAGNTADPTGAFWAATAAAAYASSANAAMAPGALSAAGGNQPHDNLSPIPGAQLLHCPAGHFPVSELTRKET